MATEEVRYVGEAVACVVARDRYAAADALEAVDVDYEPLPPVLDIRTALDESSPKVHEAGDKSFEWVFGNGDIDAAFSGAPVALERNYRQQRLIPSAMEPRSLAHADPAGDLPAVAVALGAAMIARGRTGTGRSGPRTSSWTT